MKGQPGDSLRKQIEFFWNFEQIVTSDKIITSGFSYEPMWDYELTPDKDLSINMILNPNRSLLKSDNRK